MTESSAPSTVEVAPAPPAGRDMIIDCDVHNGLRSIADLGPYLSSAWQARIGLEPGAMTGMGMTSFTLPWGHYTKPRGGMRRDAISPNGGAAGTDPDFVVEQLLDEHGIDYAILNTGDMITLGGMGFPDLAVAIAAAVNDWLVDVWLERDPRFLGAVIVAPQDPLAAAAEIRRAGQHPRMVQVMISSTRTRLGNRIYHPIYEAAEEMGLPVAWHLGSESAGMNGSLFAAGPPTSYIEAQSSYSQVAQAQVMSMVCEGVFEKFPDFKFIITEGGVGWLPHVMWRLDRQWQGTQDELPWLKKPPSEYIRQGVRLTTQPLEEPANRDAVVALLDTVKAEDLLLFATDYPHWDFDNPVTTLQFFPEESRTKIFSGNALTTYSRLPGIVASAPSPVAA